MASKKGISYKWRLFTPVLLAFWCVLIGMAWWQLYRVSEIKKSMVYDTLSMIAERVAYFYSRGEYAQAEDFMRFANDFFSESNNYDPVAAIVIDPDGTTDYAIGLPSTRSYAIPVADEGDESTGMVKINKRDGSMVPFLYYTTTDLGGHQIVAMLPYTKAVAERLNPRTTRFWLILAAIAIFVTIFTYISATFFGRTISILRNFAQKAASKEDMGEIDTYNFPHDELGDISREIVTIYKQRIDEMERSEREHKVALNAIEEKNRIKRELTGNINHELKTPVGVIQGYLDTIIDDPDMEPATRERFLLKAQQNVHRLSDLINDITAITKLESGGKLVNVVDVDFHDLVFTFANFVEESNLLGGKMDFTFDIPLNCKVMGNESLLASVLTNLVKNAVQYSHGTYCRVEYAHSDDKMHHFKFYDDGVGVAPEHLPHMFERFFRVNSGRSRDAGGTGLGLAIVEVTIQSFGGHIEVMNRYPSGLEYHFSLPKASLVRPVRPVGFV